jgi:hypothetical protein
MAFDLSTARPEGGFDLSTAKPLEEEEPKVPKEPLSFLERGKFAFGETKGRKQFLERKFPSELIEQLPTGKFTVSGIPVDPEGFDIGDIADVADEIVRLGFQIKGATLGGAVGAFKGAALGTPSGPAGQAAGAASLGTLGVITGGGAGRALGQGFVTGLGKEFGVRDDEIIDVAKDIAKEGAIGVAGEAGGQLLTKASAPTAKFLSGFFNKVKRKFNDPSLQNFFNFTAGIEKNSIARVQQKGTKNILTRENMSEEAVLNVANKIQNGVKKARSIRGQEVAKAKTALKNSNARIEIVTSKKRFNAELRKADILDDAFQVKDPLIRGTDTARDKLLSVKETLDGFKGKAISAKEALRLKSELDDIIKFGREGKITIGTNENRILTQLRNQLDSNIKIKSPALAQADEAFAELARTEDILKNQLSLPTGETFLKKVLSDKSPAFSRQKLIELNSLLFKKDKFIEKLRDVVAARDFASGTFRGIRSGIFGGALGSLGLFGGPGLGVAGLGTGIAVSTPRAVGGIIGAQQTVGQLIKSGLGTTARTAGREAVPAVLEKFTRGGGF